MNLRSRAELNRAMLELANGDRSAVQAIFDALWPALRSWCRRWLPAADADDAAQQALLRLFAQAAAFDADGDALSWALSVAAWECRTIRKRAARRGEHQIDAVVVQNETPEALFLAAEQAQLAQTLLDSVADDERAFLEQLFAEAPTAPKDAATRKRKQRVLERVRAAWRKMYGPT